MSHDTQISAGFSEVGRLIKAANARLVPTSGTTGSPLVKTASGYAFDKLDLTAINAPANSDGLYLKVSGGVLIAATGPAASGGQAFEPFEVAGSGAANQAITLPISGLTAKALLVTAYGLRLPFADYTVSGTTLTISPAIDASAKIIVSPTLGQKGDPGSGGGATYTAGVGITITGSEIALDQNANLYFGGEVYFDQAPKIYGASIFNLFASKNTPVNTITAAAYTMTAADAAQHFRMDNTGANTFTIPNESSMVVGTTVDVQQVNTGQTTIVAASGVTFESAAGYTKLKERYSAVTIRKVGPNRWTLIGALVA